MMIPVGSFSPDCFEYPGKEKDAANRKQSDVLHKNT